MEIEKILVSLKIPTNLKSEFRLVGIFSVDFAYTSDYNKIRF